MQHRDEIRIRDPYIYADDRTKKYYMYGTTELKKGLAAGSSFSVYISEDLEHFEEPIVIFDGVRQNFWATHDYWAPEVHYYNGCYYLFASFKADGQCRGTQILKSDNLTGPFVPITEYPVTPRNWECLDGTFWQENGKPYIIFCHEWVQCGNGEIYAAELSEDLSRMVQEPILLFRAGDHPLIRPFTNKVFDKCYVTDGPFIYSKNGLLHMLWSSLSQGKYLTLVATADSIYGPWQHEDTPLFEEDGGHSMVFSDFEAQTKIALHCPNVAPNERLKIISCK